MKSKGSNKTVDYNNYLKTLTKNELILILDDFHIEYKKNKKRQDYENLIINSVTHIVDYSLNLFQNDEINNLKFLIKKKGKVTIKFNYLLLTFLKNLERHKLVINVENNTYIMPLELLAAYKYKLKSKNIQNTIKKNTDEYNLILGLLDAYGVIEFDKFYNIYSKAYTLKTDAALERIKNLATFFNEFNVYEDKKKIYIASIVIMDIKECKRIAKIPCDYIEYTPEQLIDIHTFKYMLKFRSYKKLMKFINRNYEVSKSSFKIINKYVLIPYLTNYQQDPSKAKEILFSLIDQYFEFNNDKHKNRFTALIENLALDYPCWELKGQSKRERK